MEAVQPVLLNPIEEPSQEVVMGENQPQYIPLPTLAITREDGRGEKYFLTVSRWKLSEDERQAIVMGADIVHQVVHSRGAYPPMNLQVVASDQDPQLVRGER